MVTAGQPASGRKANSDVMLEDSKERLSSKALGQETAAEGVGCDSKPPAFHK